MFKVGDYVRRTTYNKNTEFVIGAVYCVESVNCQSGMRLQGSSAENFEPWEPRAGDWVQYNNQDKMRLVTAFDGRWWNAENEAGKSSRINLEYWTPVLGRAPHVEEGNKNLVPCPASAAGVHLNKPDDEIKVGDTVTCISFDKAGAYTWCSEFAAMNLLGERRIVKDVAPFTGFINFTTRNKEGSPEWWPLAACKKVDEIKIGDTVERLPHEGLDVSIGGERFIVNRLQSSSDYGTIARGSPDGDDDFFWWPLSACKKVEITTHDGPDTGKFTCEIVAKCKHEKTTTNPYNGKKRCDGCGELLDDGRFPPLDANGDPKMKPLAHPPTLMTENDYRMQGDREVSRRNMTILREMICR